MPDQVHAHLADAIKAPEFVRLADNLYIARFESMKIYSALAAVERLLRDGVVGPDAVLLDSSSGIYAYALALACHKYRLRCHIVGSRTIDVCLKLQLQVLGATVEQVQPQATLKLDQSARVARIAELMRTNPHMYWMQQYHDDVHYLGYAPVAGQIREALGDVPLSVVGCVGSGCSTGGIALALRQRDASVQLTGVQPFGSVSFGAAHVEDPGIIIAGIGSSIAFRNVRHALYDRLHWVGFDHGLSGAVALLREHAVFAGLSSGCAYLVARREARIAPDRCVVLIAADTGHRYVDAVYARHAEAVDPDLLEPRAVRELSELALPWSCMDWARREYAAAVPDWPPPRASYMAAVPA